MPPKREKRRGKRGSNVLELEKQENIEERADKNHDFNTKTSISMTKKANYTFAKHFHGGGNDFHLLSSFPRHNKSAEKLYFPKNNKDASMLKAGWINFIFPTGGSIILVPAIGKYYFFSMRDSK